jgi:thiol-disulfide isomerase/thioredoxin
MAIVSRRWRLLASCLLVLSGLSPAHAAPTVQQMLGYKPRQDGVNYSSPAPEAEASCKVELVKGARKGSGWQLKDDKGNVLRLFFDSNDDNKIDVWSYYKDGVEVYREIDTTFSGRPDQYRWLNAGGSKWGVDDAKDGRIKAWKVISPEEVSQEVLSALATKDLARLQTLLISETEIKALELPADMAARVRQQVKDVPAKFEETVKKLGDKIGPKATWVHLETAAPQCQSSDATGGRYDIVRHTRGTILYEHSGNSGWIQTGEMIQAGATWRLTSAPVPGAFGDEPDKKGGPDVSENPKLMKAVEELTAHDRMAPPANSGPDPRVVEHHLKRADILERIIADAKPEEREPWIRQVADSLSTAASSSPKGDSRSMTRLLGLEQQLTEKMPGSNLAAYVTFRELQANYAISLGGDPKDFNKVQADWVEKLAKFVSAYPKAEDTPDAMLQAGAVSEFLGKDVEAKNWYAQVVKNFAGKPQAEKAAGAVKRLDSDGQSLKIAAPMLSDPNKAFDIDQLKGKVVVVYYWASWNSQCANDFTKLKQLVDANKGVELLSVNLDTRGEEAKAFLMRHGDVPGIQLYQPGGQESKLATEYGIMSLPHLFLVNRDGKVASHTVQVNNLEDEIKKLK